MTIILPKEKVQDDFAQQILRAWREAHGADKGRVHLSWGQDRVVVIIEDAFLKGERLLAQSKEGKAVLEQYVHELLAHVVAEQKTTLAHLLQRKIVDTSISCDSIEQWVMIIFRFAE